MTRTRSLALLAESWGAPFAALALLIVSVFVGVMGENTARSERLHGVEVQADILARSLAAPLAFDDGATTRAYVDAYRADSSVLAVGAYDARGKLVASFTRSGAVLPVESGGAFVKNARNVFTIGAPVAEGTTHLGAVVLDVVADPFWRRLSRYAGIGIVAVMAVLLVLGIGWANGRLREANSALQAEVREREKAQEALRQSQKMEAMGQLTGGVAHDFNNLLMVASSGLDLMERTSDPIRKDRLKQGIRQAIDRGANLTQQLLAFARKSPLKTEVFNVSARLEGMIAVLERSLREDISVKVISQPDLWPVEVDPSQFDVAVLNIALNARDAMPSGGVVTITLSNVEATGLRPDRVEVQIADTGVGMPPELISRVFEPFFTTKGVGEGTGLGLSQVYGFARSSNGEVRIESEIGRGSRVTLSLPRSLKDISAANEAVPRRRGPSERFRILLVEDDDRVAELVQEMLVELGYDVTRAPNAASALDQLRLEQSFDIVFSDMVMPGEMNGLDLAREIMRQRTDLPVILTTGYSASAAEAAAEGMRLLVKPYRIEALATELSEALGAKKSTPTAH